MRFVGKFLLGYLFFLIKLRSCFSPRGLWTVASAWKPFSSAARRRRRAIVVCLGEKRGGERLSLHGHSVLSLSLLILGGKHISPVSLRRSIRSYAGLRSFLTCCQPTSQGAKAKITGQPAISACSLRLHPMFIYQLSSFPGAIWQSCHPPRSPPRCSRGALPYWGLEQPDGFAAPLLTLKRCGGEGDELTAMLCSHQPLGPCGSFFSPPPEVVLSPQRALQAFPVAATTEARVLLLPPGEEKHHDPPVAVRWDEAQSSELCPAPASALGQGRGSSSGSPLLKMGEKNWEGRGLRLPQQRRQEEGATVGAAWRGDGSSPGFRVSPLVGPGLGGKGGFEDRREGSFLVKR